MSEDVADSPRVAALQDENRRLRRAVEELSLINDISRAISASMDSREIMNVIVRRSVRAVNAEQGVITLVDRQSEATMKTLVRAMVSSSSLPQFHMTQSLLGWMHLNKKPLTLNSPRTDSRFTGVRWEETIRSLACVPMMIKSELTGVLTIYNKKDASGFQEDDQRLLAIIAAQSAQVVENARLNEREKQLLKMQEELRLAVQIQTELLPKEPPHLPGYDIAGRTIPAQSVGGDYFDFIALDDGRLALALGDVTGKGLPAALLMANLQATLRAQTLAGPTVRESVERANRLLYQSTSPEKFATLFFAFLDPVGHTIAYCNAGHEHPWLLGRDGSVRRLDRGGVALAMFEGFPFDEDRIELHEGDLLVVASDGISEAMDAGMAQFGDERLGAVVREHRDRTAAEIVDTIVAAVRTHSGSAPQTDDMTLLALKRNA